MRIRIRKIGYLTGLILSVCVLLNGICVKAAVNESVNIAEDHLVPLSSLKLTGLNKPVTGVPFDTSAKIVSAQGVSWEIPVLWIDGATGLLSAIPEAGKRYYPSFVFYVPAGYKITGTDMSGRFDIRLPDFVKKLLPSGRIIYAVDPASGITYIITWGDEVPSPYRDKATAKTATYSAPNSMAEEDIKDPVDVIWTPYVSKKVGMYCDDRAIEIFGNDFLEFLIDMISNTLLPQAANLLKEGFDDSLGSAQPGYELSDEIGLYIYYDHGIAGGYELPSGLLGAFVADYTDADRFDLILAINGEFVATLDPESGYVVLEYGKILNFDNTVVHELLHGFLYDYTRYGQMSGIYDQELRFEAGFPMWFMEGLASAVENIYQYRWKEFTQLAEDRPDEQGLCYTRASVLDGYINPRIALSSGKSEFIMDIDYKDGMSEAPYQSGYLASLYLGYMDAVSRGLQPLDEYGNIDVAMIRDGLDDVLLRLHGTDGTDAQSMDQIIAAISDGRYEDTLDYQKKFIKGEDNSGDDDGSLDFAVAYLSWLNAESEKNGITASGSILLEDQGISDPLDWDETAESDVYNIAEKSGMVTSSVDDRRANQTGGRSCVGTGSPYYLTNVPSDIAAKICSTVESETETVSDREAVSDREPVIDEMMMCEPPELILQETDHDENAGFETPADVYPTDVYPGDNDHDINGSFEANNDES